MAERHGEISLDRFHLPDAPIANPAANNLERRQKAGPHRLAQENALVVRQRNHLGRKLRVRRKSLLHKHIPPVFNTKLRKLVVVRMRRRDVNQVNRGIRRQVLVAAVRPRKTVLLGKSLRLFQVAGRHGVTLHAHPLVFQSHNSGSHLRRNMAAPQNCKFQNLHAVNIYSTRPRPSKKAANTVYRCSRPPGAANSSQNQAKSFTTSTSAGSQLTDPRLSRSSQRAASCSRSVGLHPAGSVQKKQCIVRWNFG